MSRVFLPWNDLGRTAYSEIAGVQISNIDLDSRTLLIRESVSWCNADKVFEYLKTFPKNGQPKHVHLHDELLNIITRRLKRRVKGCNYLFHINGEPLNYCTIQSNFRSAQRKAKIKYTGTHILRHGMTTLARRVGGSLDDVIAMTGHKDLKLADHYSKLPYEANKNTSEKILKHLKEQGLIKNMDSFDNVIEFQRPKSNNDDKN